MSDETDDAGEPTTAARKPRKIKRKIPRRAAKEVRAQSSISFPYQDLESAISVARAIYNAGGVALSRDQLAGVMNLAVASGNFVLKMAAARMFGVVATEGGKYALSPLGFEILDKDEKRQRKARAEAFLSVPLYKRVYDEFRGKQLPPRPLGLENTFVQFGIVPKQKSTARLIFDKSATQAGFFPNGPDRLIEPIIGPMSTKPVPIEEAGESDGTPGRPIIGSTYIGGADNGAAGRHPFIQGLLDTLPAPQTNWTMEGRAKWLQAAANIFDLIYKGNGTITVSAKAEHAEGKEG
jgi:hypothetical protein